MAQIASAPRLRLGRVTSCGETRASITMALMDQMDVKVEVAGGDIITIQVTKVTGARRRMRGMIHRSRLPDGSALLFRAKQVHTFRMDRAIDVLHLGRDGDVVSIATVVPNRFSRLVLEARWVLEMERGQAMKLGIGAGSRVLLAERGRR